MAELEREIGASIITDKGGEVYLRHRRAKLQEVYYMCKECPIGALHEFNHGHEVVKEQKVIKETGRLENPAYLEQNMEMYSVHQGRLYSGHTLNVEG